MPWAARTRSTVSCRAVSMPRPSRSNFTRPAAAQSSLSHWRTDADGGRRTGPSPPSRPVKRPHSTGHTSTTGRSHSTMPPEWMPRWRGKCSTSAARSSTSSGSWLRRARSPARLGRGLHPAPGVGRLGEGVLLAGGVAERLGHVADRRLGPVGDDVGDLGGVAAAVALVDVLDDLLAPVRLDVDVDVGRAVALGRQEPLEQQAEPHRIGVGDAEGEADRRVGRAPPALAEDVGPPAELDQVPHDEEVAGEPQGLDEGQLVVDLLPRPRHAWAGDGGRSAVRHQLR